MRISALLVLAVSLGFLAGCIKKGEAPQVEEQQAGGDKKGETVATAEATTKDTGGTKTTETTKPAVPPPPSGPDPEKIAAAIKKLGGRCEMDDKKNIVFVTLAGHETVNDAALDQLKGMTHLKELDLSLTGITDAGLAKLKELTALETLELYKTNVTDAGLAHLEGLKKLKELNLARTAVTDKGLAHLQRTQSAERPRPGPYPGGRPGRHPAENLVHLAALDFTGTKVSEQGVKELQKTLKKAKMKLK